MVSKGSQMEASRKGPAGQTPLFGGATGRPGAMDSRSAVGARAENECEALAQIIPFEEEAKCVGAFGARPETVGGTIGHVAPCLRQMATDLGLGCMNEVARASHLAADAQSMLAPPGTLGDAWNRMEIAAEAWEQRKLLHRVIAVLRACEGDDSRGRMGLFELGCNALGEDSYCDEADAISEQIVSLLRCPGV